ncbi:MAG: sulfatase [bacterium]
MKLGFEVRNAIMFYANHSLKKRMDIPPNSRMRFGVGIKKKKRAAPFRLAVFLEEEGRPPVKLKSTLLSRESNRWKDLTVDLSGHEGPDRNLIIQVTTTGKKSRTGKVYLSDVKFDPESRLQELSDRPNIVLICVDTLRPDHLTTYGYDIRKTDSFFKGLWEKQGVKFEKVYSPSSWTLPAVASIMTSMHLSEHGSGIKNVKYGKLDKKLDTLAEILSREGYDTAAFSVSFIVSPHFRFHQGFDTFSDLSFFTFYWDGDRKAVNHAQKWISKNRERPFFAFFHLMNPHVPYSVGPHLKDPSSDRMRAIVIEDYIRSTLFNYYDSWKLEPPPRDRKYQRENRLLRSYDNEIKRTNDPLEEFYAALEYEGLLDNTLIIITSDHGEEFKEHGGLEHGKTLYQEVIHVPLIIAGPMIKNPGRSISCPVTTLDLMPTILEITGTNVPSNARGESLWPLIEHNECIPRHIHSELDKGVLGAIKEAVIYDGYKLVKSWKRGKVKTELFDLEADPREKNNLAKDRPNMVKKMSPLLEDMLKKRDRYIQKAKESRISDKNKDVLKALGYLD